MKKDLGNMLALYPTPACIVGAMVDGKPNWLQVAHIGIIGHDRILISSMKRHYTNRGIHETGVLSISLADQAMLPKLDVAGSASGATADKSELFAWHFICSIDATLVEEDKLDEKGKPDYEKISPVLFEFPTYSYLATGKKLGKCLSFKGKSE